MEYRFKNIYIDGNCKAFDKNLEIINQILSESVRKTGRYENDI